MVRQTTSTVLPTKYNGPCLLTRFPSFMMAKPGVYSTIPLFRTARVWTLLCTEHSRHATFALDSLLSKSTCIPWQVNYHRELYSAWLQKKWVMHQLKELLRGQIRDYYGKNANTVFAWHVDCSCCFLGLEKLPSLVSASAGTGACSLGIRRLQPVCEDSWSFWCHSKAAGHRCLTWATVKNWTDPWHSSWVLPWHCRGRELVQVHFCQQIDTDIQTKTFCLRNLQFQRRKELRQRFSSLDDKPDITVLTCALGSDVQVGFAFFPSLGCMQSSSKVCTYILVHQEGSRQEDGQYVWEWGTPGRDSSTLFCLWPFSC